MNSLTKIRDALKSPTPEQIITLDDDLSKRAAHCIERMFELAD
jgi:quinolinate synthase